MKIVKLCEKADCRPVAKMANRAYAYLGICVTAWSALLNTTPASAQSSRPGMGATPYADALGTGVTFRVWAPNVTNVSVPGSFNGWNTAANFLVQEGSSGLWSGDIPAARAADPNKNQYKYFLNNSIWKLDPRGRQLVSSVGNTIIYDPNAFDWGGDTRLSVNPSDLVIYEMHVGAFYDPAPAAGGPGKFTDAIAKLDHLIELGINAVELMPVMEFPGDYSWGYNLSDPYAVENTGYGGPDGLKAFVKAAHQRGIRVLLDVVHNHYGPGDLDMYGFDNGSTPGIYFYSAVDICCTPWGSRPNYSSEGVRSFIIDSFRLWLDEYHVDGFRWDAVGAMRQYAPNSYSIPEADTLIQYINSTIIHGDHPGAISIAEDDSSGMNFDGEWDRSFGDKLISEIVKTTDSSRDMVGLFNEMNGSGFSRVVFDETHDLVGDLNGPGNQRLPYRIQPSDPASYFARKRSMLAAAVVFCMPGTPMLFMGQEMLETQQFGDGNPLHWSNLTNYSSVVSFYRDLIHLRRNLEGVSLGLTGPNMTSHVVDDSAKVLAFHRWGAGANDQVMVVMNFSNQAITNYLIGGFPANGTWYVNLNSDLTTYGSDFGNIGSSLIQVSGSSGRITIGPYSVLVLSLASPVLKFTDIRVQGGQVILSWKGGQAVRQILKQASQLSGPWNAIFTNNPPTAITNSITIPQPVSSTSLFRIETAP